MPSYIRKFFKFFQVYISQFEDPGKEVLCCVGKLFEVGNGISGFQKDSSGVTVADSQAIVNLERGHKPRSGLSWVFRDDGRPSYIVLISLPVMLLFSERWKTGVSLFGWVQTTVFLLEFLWFFC